MSKESTTARLDTCPTWCAYRGTANHRREHYGPDRFAAATGAGPWFQTCDEGALFSSVVTSAYQDAEEPPAVVYLGVNQILPPAHGMEGQEHHAYVNLTPLEAVTLAQNLLATAREVVDGGRS